MKRSVIIVATLASLLSYGAMASTSAPAVSVAHSGISPTKAENHTKIIKHDAKVKSEKEKIEKGKKSTKTKEDKQGAI